MQKGSSSKQNDNKKTSLSGSRQSSPPPRKQSSSRQSASSSRPTPRCQSSPSIGRQASLWRSSSPSPASQPSRTSSMPQLALQPTTPFRFSNTHNDSIINIKVSKLNDQGHPAPTPSQRNCAFAIRNTITDKFTICSLHEIPSGRMVHGVQDGVDPPWTEPGWHNLFFIGHCSRWRIGRLNAILTEETSDASSESWVRTCLARMVEVGLIPDHERAGALLELYSPSGLDGPIFKYLLH